MTTIDLYNSLGELIDEGYGDCRVFIHTSETETSTLLPLEIVQAVSEPTKAMQIIDPTFKEFIILK